jgi:hypothetical protein
MKNQDKKERMNRIRTEEKDTTGVEEQKTNIPIGLQHIEQQIRIQKEQRRALRESK